MNHHERRMKEMLRVMSAEEVAEDEARIIKDSARMERLPLIKQMRSMIEEVDEVDPKFRRQMDEVFDHIVNAMALWKRNDVMARVALRRRLC